MKKEKKRIRPIRSVSFEPNILESVDAYCKKFKTNRSTVINEALELYLLQKSNGQYSEYLISMMESVMIEALETIQVKQAISNSIRDVAKNRNKTTKKK